MPSEYWETKKDTEPNAYEDFMATHDCSINHPGSLGSMKAAGLVDCFKWSIQNRDLRYTIFTGDDDTKPYLVSLDNGPYQGVTVQKPKCVENFQKRVGAWLRNIKSENKGKLTDGKPLSGKDYLTEKAINNLQNYFGITRR